jgi:hypothetical protein
MTAVALRQSRTELAVIGLILLALAAYLVPSGLDRFADYENSGLKACVEDGRACGQLRDRLVSEYDKSSFVTGWFHVIPGIAGLVLAFPIVSEFEQRTYRLAWTQSISRERWLAAKVLVGLVGVLAFALAFTAVHTWWFHPLDRSVTLAGRDLGQSFGFEGVVPFCYTLFAYSLAVSAGVVTRKTLAAVGVALGGFIAIRLTLESVFRGLSSEASFEAPGENLAATEMTRDMERFWTVQAIEGLIFVAAALVLLGVTWWVVRRTS